MRLLVVATVLFFLFSTSVFAKGPAVSAEYIVPTSPELVEHSRFIVKINEPYMGDSTTSLSYTFPPELTGEPGLTVSLKRIPGTKNSWESPELKAHCTTVDDWFSCNIYLNKGTAKALQARAMTLLPSSMSSPYINKADVVEFLTNNVSSESLPKKIAVLDQFLSSEPAGILSYEF